MAKGDRKEVMVLGMSQPPDKVSCARGGWTLVNQFLLLPFSNPLVFSSPEFSPVLSNPRGLLFHSFIPFSSLVFYIPCHPTLPYSKFPFTQVLFPVLCLFALTTVTSLLPPHVLDHLARPCLFLWSTSPTNSSAWLLQLRFWTFIVYIYIPEKTKSGEI